MRRTLLATKLPDKYSQALKEYLKNTEIFEQIYGIKWEKFLQNEQYRFDILQKVETGNFEKVQIIRFSNLLYVLDLL